MVILANIQSLFQTHTKNILDIICLLVASDMDHGYIADAIKYFDLCAAI